MVNASDIKAKIEALIDQNGYHFTEIKRNPAYDTIDRDAYGIGTSSGYILYTVSNGYIVMKPVTAQTNVFGLAGEEMDGYFIGYGKSTYTYPYGEYDYGAEDYITINGVDYVIVEVKRHYLGNTILYKTLLLRRYK